MDFLIYPIMICAIALTLAMIVLTYAVSSITMAVRKRRAAAIKDWKARGVEFVLGPAQANFLNEPRSFGVGGNGTLVLSDTAIHFAEVSPAREIVIPLKDIESAAIVKSFNGRWGGGPFFVVKRRVGDLTGFQTGNSQKWADKVNEMIGASPAGELIDTSEPVDASAGATQPAK